MMATRYSESKTHGGGGKIELTYSFRHRTRPRFNYLMTTMSLLEVTREDENEKSQWELGMGFKRRYEQLYLSIHQMR